MPLHAPPAIAGHTEEIHDIVTSPPSWLLKWGITLFFMIFCCIILMASLIRFPDLVRAQLTVYSLDGPKPVVAKISGRLTKILVSDNTVVEQGQPIAYLESTAAHADVVTLLGKLEELQQHLQPGSLDAMKWINSPASLQLGELQSAYANFYQSYLLYRASATEGLNLKKKKFLTVDLQAIEAQRKELIIQKSLQDKDYQLSGDEFKMHEKLYLQKVETAAELGREKSKVISKAYPVTQTEIALLVNSRAYQDRKKDLLELENTVHDQELNFIQSLNSIISAALEWKAKYVLYAPQPGKIVSSGVVQENQFVNSGQVLFYVKSGKSPFFGEITIPQYNMGKIKVGQDVLVKLKSYPFEEYGALNGQITMIADIPTKDSVFVARVKFMDSMNPEENHLIMLKNGMAANAEIITNEASLTHRLFRSLTRMVR
ncbi:HlyD family efflux transporter periplasmic adaptor subunit [Mucilaginibacter sp.]|uniref:HlyD family efflux transporter periplasmic adaptor subunit n=1 Tax=Mucilaginibacter sp. TaxID=1882438 RepID=UPI0025F508BC|nr:HlyD family efflux transporter periplasmic adaptor subunit [Mucilaginibacter sp.]